MIDESSTQEKAVQPASEEPKHIRLTLKYQKQFSQVVPFNPRESLAELKQYLTEGTLFHLYDNFHFELAGKLLPQYAELEGIVQPDSELDIVVDPYDERTSMYHVKRVQELVRNPVLWAVFNYKEREQKPKEQSIKEKDLTIENSLEPSFTSPLFSQPQQTVGIESVTFLNMSGYNPPPSSRRLCGDFYYMHVRTLESVDYHITANPRGFYVNNSNVNYFDPQPHTQYGRVYSSLFDLLNDLSPKFKRCFDEILENTVLSEVERVVLSLGYKNSAVWLTNSNRSGHKWNSNRADDNEPIDNGMVKDWNEMFQAQAVLPAENLFEKLNKTKMFLKIYSQFIQAASAGAKALVEGKMAPLNPLDEKLQHIYIHNSIFYSIAQETPYSYEQEKGIDATPTVSAVNVDLRNLNRLMNLNVPELHVLHMVMVEYRGYRIIAQCIIPGILTADQLQCSQYGSIDDGKTINDNRQFGLLMEQVCEKLDLEPNVQFVDQEGAKKKISGSIEIKGILGSDKRKYILDLMRLSPRDYNYLGAENHTCVLRHELIDLYKESLQPQQPELKILGPKPLEVKINVNLETGIQFTRTSETEKQEELLKTLAKFLRETCIPKLIASLTSTDKRLLSDTRGLTEVFHKHGVNMRYLGEVYQHKATAEYPQVKLILERVVLVKCAKHLFRMAMRESSPLQLSIVLSRLLNCLFAGKAQLANLEDGKLSESKKEAVVEEPKGKGSKKKKGTTASKQKLPIEEGCDGGIKIPDSPYLNIKPSEVWQSLKKLAQARYHFELSDRQQNFQGFGIPFNKLAAVRDLCLSIGLRLERREYNIFSNKDTEGELPFQPENIVELQVISKHVSLDNTETKKIIEAADNQLNATKIEEAMQLYNTAVQYLTGLYGGLHRDIARVHHKIATIYYRLTDYDSAIACEGNCLEILKQLYGEDHVDTIESISSIGLYYFSKGNKDKALFYLYKSLFLCNFAFGEGYPEAIVNYMNISAIYQQNRQFQLAIVCMMEILERIIRVYGKDNINTAVCYTGLANLHYEISDFRQCIDYQEKSVNVLKHALKQTDPRLVDAMNMLNYYREVFNMKKAQDEQSIRKAPAANNGSNNKQPRMQQVEENPERAMLLRRLQQAKLNSRLGLHR